MLIRTAGGCRRRRNDELAGGAKQQWINDREWKQLKTKQSMNVSLLYMVWKMSFHAEKKFHTIREYRSHLQTNLFHPVCLQIADRSAVQNCVRKSLVGFFHDWLNDSFLHRTRLIEWFIPSSDQPLSLINSTFFALKDVRWEIMKAIGKLGDYYV